MSTNPSITSGNYIDIEGGKNIVNDVGGKNIQLTKQLAGDVAIASVVAAGIAPFISIIDKSVVQCAAGTHTISQSILESVTGIARNPVAFVKSPAFLLMCGVYGSTYTTGKDFEPGAHTSLHYLRAWSQSLFSLPLFHP